MNSPFETPPPDALSVNAERPLSINYKSNKTPQAYANKATQEAIPAFVANGALGFSYYDKEGATRHPLQDFTFVLLEVYAGIAGYDDKNKISYWSSRAKDTRKDPITVWASTNKANPILSGLYEKGGFIGKYQLPAGAGYRKFVQAYCIELDRLVEIELTASSERGMQKAVALSMRSDNWKKVYVQGLPDNDHLWGFKLTGYARETKEGDEYQGHGELYFSPVFHAGILSPVNQKEMHAKCSAMQDQVRSNYAANRAKYDGPVAEQAPISEPSATPYQPAAAPPATTAPASVPYPDDLPF